MPSATISGQTSATISGQTAVVFIDFDLRPVARRMHSDEDTIEVSVSLLMKSEFDHQILMFAT